MSVEVVLWNSRRNSFPKSGWTDSFLSWREIWVDF